MPTALPQVLALLAAGAVALAAAGLMLVRDAGPLPAQASQHRDAGSAVDRLVARCGRPVAGLLVRGPGAAYLGLVGRLLAQAGRTPATSPRAFADLHAGFVLVTAVLAAYLAAIGLGRPALVLASYGLARPYVRLVRQARARQAELARDMPAFLELLAVLLAAGHTFRHALARVAARVHGPLAQELRTLLLQLEFGATPRAALDDLVRRSSVPSVQQLAAVVKQCEELGSPVAEALVTMADDVRAEATVRLRQKAQSAATAAVLVQTLLAIPAVGGIALIILLSEAADDLGWLFG